MNKCTNIGCLKEYKEEDNNDTACVYHDGQAMFHDLKKGWTCCNQIVYDWDEFSKLKGCKIGKHSNIKKANNVNDLWKHQFNNNNNSNTDSLVSNNVASNNLNTNIKDIAQYEEEQKKIKEEKEKEKQEALNINKEPLKDKDGKLYCCNAGCKDKVFVEEENKDDACHHHSGHANFHDLRKYWSCCKNETWDWDEFMKLPTCAVGRHKPKYKK